VFWAAGLKGGPFYWAAMSDVRDVRDVSDVSDVGATYKRRKGATPMRLEPVPQKACGE
jgi:hypothetical protein